jgi:hypothetical protein
MKSKINTVYDILMGWTNRAEIKKYKSMIQDNNELISQAEYVIEKQEEIVDKGRLIKSNKVTYITMQKNVDYEKALNVKANMEILKVNLNTINGFYDDLIKEYSGRFLAKQDIIADANTKILNLKNTILNLTGGSSPKEYIDKCLPEELK